MVRIAPFRGVFYNQKKIKDLAKVIAPPRGIVDPLPLTRDEHLAWCKRRALEYVDAGDLTHAVASMASDLKTHPDTDNPALNGLVMIGMMYVTDGDKAAVQRWIERFR